MLVVGFFFNPGREADFFPSCWSRRKKRKKRKRGGRRGQGLQGKQLHFKRKQDPRVSSSRHSTRREESSEPLPCRRMTTQKVKHCRFQTGSGVETIRVNSILMQCLVKPEGGIADTDVLTKYDKISFHVCMGHLAISDKKRIRLSRLSALKS